VISCALLAAAISGCAATPPRETNGTEEIFKPEGSIQCRPESGVSAAELRAELEAMRIPILAYRHGHDGMIYPAVCGAPTGRIHVFSIPVAKLAAAQARGYRRVRK
jgi:hypothetical protein